MPPKKTSTGQGPRQAKKKVTFNEDSLTNTKAHSPSASTPPKKKRRSDEDDQSPRNRTIRDFFAPSSQSMTSSSKESIDPIDQITSNPFTFDNRSAQRSNTSSLNQDIRSGQHSEDTMDISDAYTDSGKSAPQDGQGSPGTATRAESSAHGLINNPSYHGKIKGLMHHLNQLLEKKVRLTDTLDQIKNTEEEVFADVKLYLHLISMTQQWMMKAHEQHTNTAYTLEMYSSNLHATKKGLSGFNEVAGLTKVFDDAADLYKVATESQNQAEETVSMICMMEKLKMKAVEAFNLDWEEWKIDGLDLE